ncbi:MAG TPA: ABC transporter substrate-binding protein [Caldimonas sp.]|nr:ABC transporter substrate-binding protein [Caldimonas sp.]
MHPDLYTRRAATTNGLARLLVLSSFLTSSPAVRAQQPATKMHRIGYLVGGSAADGESARLSGAFRSALAELGWVEGQNLAIEYRFAEGKFDRLPFLAADLVRMNVELIVALATPAALAARDAARAIPIVMVSVGDPVGLGLITSLAKPGGNVTGLSYTVGAFLVDKQLQLLKEAVPGLERVGVLLNPANPSHASALDYARDAARQLGLSLFVSEARGPTELTSALERIVKQRAQALLVFQDSMFTLHRAQLAEQAATSKLPSMYGLSASVEAGGLMSYGPNLSDQLRQAAGYVDKILKGAKPADLPVDQPTRFELIVNARTAKTLGMRIPAALLFRADRVIE